MSDVKNKWRHFLNVTFIFWSLFVNNENFTKKKKKTVSQLSEEIKSLLILNECDTSVNIVNDHLEENEETENEFEVM